MVGMFVCLCLARQKPSKQEFFVPARTDLGAKLLTAMDAHECPLFNKLLWWLVTFMIFVQCSRLIARKIAELFGLNRGIRPVYTAYPFNELGRGSVSCLSNASFGKRFHNATTHFLRRIWWPWHLPGQYGVNTCPMVASSGIQGSPRPSVLGDASRSALEHQHGHWNDQRRRCIFLP